MIHQKADIGYGCSWQKKSETELLGIHNQHDYYAIGVTILPDGAQRNEILVLERNSAYEPQVYKPCRNPFVDTDIKKVSEEVERRVKWWHKQTEHTPQYKF